MDSGTHRRVKNFDIINALISGIPDAHKTNHSKSIISTKVGAAILIVFVLLSLSFGLFIVTATHQKDSAEIASSQESFRQHITDDKIFPSHKAIAAPAPSPDNSEPSGQLEQNINSGIPAADFSDVEYTGPTEGVQERLNRLAQSLGITYPVVPTDCYIPGQDPTAIRGCYLTGTYYIGITKYALVYDDAFVSCVMRHEARHLWQDLNGLFDIQNGEIVNRDWLEADATAHSGCS